MFVGRGGERVCGASGGGATLVYFKGFSEPIDSRLVRSLLNSLLKSILLLSFLHLLFIIFLLYSAFIG